MRQVQLADKVYVEAQRRASAGGYSSVDEYVAEIVIQNLSQDTDNFDHLFSPQVLAHLDRISDDMKAGKSDSLQDVDQHLADVRKAWLKDHAG